MNKNNKNSFKGKDLDENIKETNSVESKEKSKNKEYDLNAIKRDSRNIQFGMNLPKEITMINVYDLVNRERDFSPYEYLNEEDTLLMKSSLERWGVIHPLIVFAIKYDKYMIVDGENRGVCLYEMFRETGDLKYKKVPCIVLTDENFSKLDLKEICISANLNKKCNYITKLKVILMMAEIYRTRYTRLKDVNVAREISGELGISISTVYNYLKLQNLCIEGEKFLNNGRIDLTAATKLANLSKELQVLIINEIGEKNISNPFIKSVSSKKTTMKNYKEKIEKVFSLRHPLNYSIKISGKYEKMEIIEEMLEDYFAHYCDDINGDIKKTVCGKCFDFSVGFSSLNEKPIYIPEYFRKFIENGEIGEIIPDSEFESLKSVNYAIDEQLNAEINMHHLKSKKRKDKQ